MMLVEVMVSSTTSLILWESGTCIASKLRAFNLEYVRNSKSSVSCMNLMCVKWLPCIMEV